MIDLLYSGRGVDEWSSRADEALDQMLGGGVRDDDHVNSPTKVVNTPPKKTQARIFFHSPYPSSHNDFNWTTNATQTFKRFQVSRKKKSKFADPLSVPRAREQMWWTKCVSVCTSMYILFVCTIMYVDVHMYLRASIQSIK